MAEISGKRAAAVFFSSALCCYFCCSMPNVLLCLRCCLYILLFSTLFSSLFDRNCYCLPLALNVFHTRFYCCCYFIYILLLLLLLFVCLCICVCVFLRFFLSPRDCWLPPLILCLWFICVVKSTVAKTTKRPQKQQCQQKMLELNGVKKTTKYTCFLRS